MIKAETDARELFRAKLVMRVVSALGDPRLYIRYTIEDVDREVDHIMESKPLRTDELESLVREAAVRIALRESDPQRRSLGLAKLARMVFTPM